MARKYGVGLQWCRACRHSCNACRCDFRDRDFQPVTAIDARDVEPLVEAARNALCRLEGIGWIDSRLQQALKAFEDEEGSE